jgi:ligand-binding SRPBCC domain-containing protein
MRGEVQVRSLVPLSPEVVWDRVSSMEGVNDELFPVLSMTHPRSLDRIVGEVPLGTRLFRSWCLLLGAIPFDYDDLTFVGVDPGRGFHERSRMLSQKVWEHERTIEPHPAGCVVTDRVRFEPRLPLGTGLVAAIVRRIFEHRHRRLARWARRARDRQVERGVSRGVSRGVVARRASPAARGAGL